VIRDEIRVVIIGDDRDVLDVLGEAVTAFGYHAFPAANAVHGLREVRERRPHVIRLDLRMPALDGHTVFERLISLATPVLHRDRERPERRDGRPSVLATRGL
jgi:DNA-binding response OmpR family regulator